MELHVYNSLFSGKLLLRLSSVASTNDYAKEYISKTQPIDGTVILADEQFAGHGQAGNSWASEPNKNLTLSIVYHTVFLKATEQFYLNMAVSLGICEAVKSLVKEEVKIKWPNDLLVNGKKIAGILIENTIWGMQLKYSVIGIGLNVNQQIFPEGIVATSLCVSAQKEFDLNEVLNVLIASVEKYFLWMKERKLESIRQEYLLNLYRYKEEASFSKDGNIFSGTITGVDESGRLMMTTEEGEKRFNFKEIVFVSSPIKE